MGPRLNADAWQAVVVKPSPRLTIPSWLVSIALHAALLVLFALTLQFAPQGASSEPARTVGLVLKEASPQGDVYAGEEDFNNQAAADPAQSASTAGDLFNAALPSDPTGVLPQVADVIGPGGAANQLLPGANSFTSGPRANRIPSQGRTRTTVFGLEGEGYKFVYVFDRSGSMGGSGRTALGAAQAELLTSLENLSDIHQFQIIFYNDYPAILEIAGNQRLVFANDQNKRLAQRFIGEITADGATNHEEALLLALRLHPDVIFFLTDADEPALLPSQLAKIRRLNGGVTTINAIEFGMGPSLGDDNFLVRLARENGGRHAYLDISGLRSGARLNP